MSLDMPGLLSQSSDSDSTDSTPAFAVFEPFAAVEPVQLVEHPTEMVTVPAPQEDHKESEPPAAAAAPEASVVQLDGNHAEVAALLQGWGVAPPLIRTSIAMMTFRPVYNWRVIQNAYQTSGLQPLDSTIFNRLPPPPPPAPEA
jgi:hypothetical protein